jgi:hypothetical protein
MAKYTFPLAGLLVLLWSLLFVWVGYTLHPDDTCPPETVRVDSTHTIERIIERVPGREVEVPLPVPYPVVVRDTVLSYPDPVTQEPTDVSVPVRSYNQTYADTSITAEWNAEVAGELLDWDFRYTPILTTITETETITVDREVVRVKQLPRLSFGASVTGLYFPESENFLLTTGPWAAVRLGEKVSLSYSPRFEVFNQTISHAGSLSIRL